MKQCKKCAVIKPLDDFYKSHLGYYDAQCKECRKAYQKRLRDQNRDVVKEKDRARYLANRQTRLEGMRKYAKENPHIFTAATRRRRARLKDCLVIKYTKEQLAERMSVWDNKCWVCGGPFEAVDHYYPIALGGPDILANLRPICRSHNSQKGAKHPSELPF